MAKSKEQKTKKVVKAHYSSGGAVYRSVPRESGVPGAQTSEWLLINPTGTDKLQLPKGTIDPGERSNTTAVREVFEETGVSGEIVKKLSTVKYFFVADGQKIFKSVVFYLMKSKGEEPKVEEQWAHEVAEVAWFPFDIALYK